MNKAWSSGFLWTRIAVCGFFWLGLSMIAHAQTICPSTQGYNAVWGTQSPNCTTLEVVGSQAIIDARAWCGTNCDTADFCVTVNDAITQALPASGGVVDARGVVHSDGTAIPCTSNPFPQPPNNVPVILLLPSAIIQVRTPWILPSNTRISGQSSGRSVLQPPSTFVAHSANAIIEMGAAAGSTGVVVEHLELDASQQAGSVGVGGIYNGNAQDGSYVDDVLFLSMGAFTNTQSPMTTGLLVDTGATGSGPYSNLNFAGVASTLCSDKVANECGTSGGNKGHASCTQTAAVQIRVATRGLHDITAVTTSDEKGGMRCAGPLAAVYLDASNNSIENAHFEGFYDGVVVGANVKLQTGPFAGNAISNVNGGFGANSGPMVNIVHICNPLSQTQTGACSSNSVSATDVIVLDATGQAGSIPISTIKDDLTGTEINSSTSAAYVLGEPVGTSQYSRFTTGLGSTNGSGQIVPTWVVSSIALTNQSCTTPGALYSNTNGSGSGSNSSNTLYLCSSGGSWVPITNQ